MENTTVIATPIAEPSSQSAVSWAAVFAGAFGAFAATLILVTLGSGLGLTAVSPWENMGASAKAITVYAAIWLVIVQWLSSGLGGYLAGRLRTKWTSLHTDEVLFRDTAHGFLAWATATLIVAALFTGLGHSAIRGTGAAAGTLAEAAGPAMAGPHRGPGPMGPRGMQDPSDYVLDTLFRPASPMAAPAAATPAPAAPAAEEPSDETGMMAPDTTTPSTTTTTAPVTAQPLPPMQNAAPMNARMMRGDRGDRAEAMHILAHSAVAGEMSAEDRTYLAQIVAARAGISMDEAYARVDRVNADAKEAADKAKQAADQARKSAATTSIVLALSLLVGAFIASAAAMLGGRLRDQF